MESGAGLWRWQCRAAGSEVWSLDWFNLFVGYDVFVGEDVAGLNKNGVCKWELDKIERLNIALCA